jgi:hypothetical protein
MRTFLLKFLFIISPILFSIIFFIIIDFFKIFKSEKFYDNDQIVNLNRELILTKLYFENNDFMKYNSFIFGSSRSQAYKTVEWLKYLPKGSKAFHFDASWESLYGILKKLEFLDSEGNDLDNVLIILDEDLLRQTRIKLGHLYIPHPKISGRSYVEFYFQFYRSSIDLNFLRSYIDYKLTYEYKPYMGMYIQSLDKYYFRHNDFTGDIYYPQDSMIINDSVGYYEKIIKTGTFNLSKTEQKKYTSEIRHILEIKDYLSKISSILNRHKSHYKIIISPNFNKLELNSDLKKLLNDHFGSSRIYNFSGKNIFTDSIKNYYERSHHRPYLANRILNIIYNNK